MQKRKIFNSELTHWLTKADMLKFLHRMWMLPKKEEKDKIANTIRIRNYSNKTSRIVERRTCWWKEKEEICWECRKSLFCWKLGMIKVEWIILAEWVSSSEKTFHELFKFTLKKIRIICDGNWFCKRIKIRKWFDSMLYNSLVCK